MALVTVVFVAALFAPLASALSLCHMPCCHHGASSSTPTCPMKCTIGSAPADVPAVASVVVQPSAPIASAQPAPPRQAIVVDDIAPPISPHRARHLVNSVFLI